MKDIVKLLRLPRVYSLVGFLGNLRVLIHYLMPTFREPCSSLHQGEEQPDTGLFF